jgi:predicted kinase
MILRGIPACGKSTFAKNLLAKEPARWKRINRDDLRTMLDDGVFDRNREEFIRSVEHQLIQSAFRAGYDVIVDNTTLVPQTLKKLHQVAQEFGDVKVIEYCFNVDVEECIKRNEKREGRARVPEKVIRDMAHAAGLDRGRKLENREMYYPPRFSGESAVDSAGYDPTSKLPKAVICDLDGTLSLLNGRSPYDASNCDKDLPNLPVIEAVKALYSQGFQILFTSGREDKYREPTIRFIEQHVRVQVPVSWNEESGPGPSLTTKVIDYKLFMRPTGDQRKDAIVKRELFDENIRGKFNVVFAYDDRNQVVDAWREMGLACFQVAPGNF